MFPRRVVGVALLSLAAGLPPGARAAETADSYPAEARAQYERGVKLQKQGQYREAVEAYEAAVRLGMKDFPRANLYAAGSLLGLKEYAAAVARYTKFLQEFSLEESCRY